MIIVTGATGQFGKAVVERLLQLIPADQIGVSVRDPEKASALEEQGVRVRRGDFDDLSSLRHAFEGASQVLVVSVNSLGPSAVQQHGNAIAAAKTAGAERVLYTSHMAANLQSAFGPARDHAATEDLLKRSGLAFTSLRNGFYAESALWFSGLGNNNTIILPQDGPVSWTTRADLADAAATALTTGSLDGITPPLTNPDALDFAAFAEIASGVLGRSIEREVVTDDAYRQSQLARGVPEPMVEGLGGFFLASRRGEFAAVDSTLERLLGHPPMSVQDFIGSALSDMGKGH